MNREQVAKLTPQERVAGYLFRSAQLADCGARLRTKYKDVSTDYSEGWSEEEELEWDSICDDLDVWWHEIKEDEWPTIHIAESVLNPLTCAEWPVVPLNIGEIISCDKKLSS